MGKAVGLAIFGLLLVSHPAMAQQKMSRSEVSKECSRQADEKNLHGKARRHFRNKCKHDMSRNK